MIKMRQKTLYTGGKILNSLNMPYRLPRLEIQHIFLSLNSYIEIRNLIFYMCAVLRSWSVKIRFSVAISLKI